MYINKTGIITVTKGRQKLRMRVICVSQKPPKFDRVDVLVKPVDKDLLETISIYASSVDWDNQCVNIWGSHIGS